MDSLFIMEKQVNWERCKYGLWIYLFISRFGFKSGICLLIAPVPVHCFLLLLDTLKNHNTGLSSGSRNLSVL